MGIRRQKNAKIIREINQAAKRENPFAVRIELNRSVQVRQPRLSDEHGRSLGHVARNPGIQQHLLTSMHMMAPWSDRMRPTGKSSAHMTNCMDAVGADVRRPRGKKVLKLTLQCVDTLLSSRPEAREMLRQLE
jgi:hypothetical protein